MDTDSLTIKDIRDDDEGAYTCIMNTTLDQDSASAMLTVVGTFTYQCIKDVHFAHQRGSIFHVFLFSKIQIE